MRTARVTILPVGLALAFCAMLGARASAAEPDAPAEGDAKSLEIYNLSQLISKAERIIVADIGAAGAKDVELIVHKTLKAPESAAKYVDPQRLQRAADLLDHPEKADLPPLVPAKAPEKLKVLPDARMKLPPQGTQAIFFLWDREGKPDQLCFHVRHPQCIYDVELLTQVQAGIDRPRSAADGRYLRPWDKQMAERSKLREIDRALLAEKGGETVMGLRMRAARPALSLRADGSFGVTASIENQRDRDQLIYDGPAGGYGARLWRKGGDPAAGLVLRLTMKGLVAGMDNSILGITDMTDFATVPGGSGMSKELFFDAKTYPALRQFSGDYLLSVFFNTSQDGKGLDLDRNAWTGTLISEPVPLRFPSPVDSQKAEK